LDILIVNPGSIRKEFQTEHLGIASLKSYLMHNGYKADILDTSIEELSVTEAVHYVLKIDPDILGISLLEATKHDGISLIKLVRTNGFKGKIVVGGYFATYASFELLRDFPEIDFVVRGEGELTLKELCDNVLGTTDTSVIDIRGLSYRDRGSIVENPARALIKDLDMLPAVDRKYAKKILNQQSNLRIYSSRGCWGRCSFCDINNFYRSSPGRNWRKRSIKHLVDEIQDLIKTYGDNYFIFNDDQFLSKGKFSYKYVNELAAELKRREMKIKFELMCRADTIDKETMILLKNIGLQRVFLGIESFNEAQLIRYNKGISVYKNIKSLITLYKLKIDVITSVILADAHTTLIELLQHFYILYRLRKRYFNSSYCRISINNSIEVYRGSDIYRQYKTNGLLETDDYMHGYHYRLKFWTRWRLKLLDFEEKLGKAFS